MNPPEWLYQGLSSLPSADSTRHRQQIDGYQRWEVIGVAKDNEFGDEGDSNPGEEDEGWRQQLILWGAL